MANKTIRLNEADLRNIIAEAVSQQLNEKNWLKNKWNKWFKKPTQQYDDWDDDNYESNNDEEQEIQPGEPFDYNPYNVDTNIDIPSESNGGIEIGGDNINNNDDYYPSINNQEPDNQNIQSNGENGQVFDNGYNDNSNDDSIDSQSSQTEQPQQPSYKRGGKYHIAFSQDNEAIFNNNIVPSYNSLNAVIKSLASLRQIGQYQYNQASSIFGEWGQNNYSGGQPAFKNVCQQIDSIMPTLNNLKQEMKNVLMANGVRDTEDYQHFNMEEQRMRNIISNSINKILSECLRK